MLFGVKRLAASLGVLAGAMLLAGCGAGGAIPSSPAAHGTPLAGGTAYFAEPALQTPNYIFPLVSGEYFSTVNTADFQTLMYRPLYWYGAGNRSGVDYSLSLGDRPVYSDHDRIVTIRLKRSHWSDGELVSARDVGFWINLLKANRDEWASYVPGGFPDNVVRWKLGAPGGAGQAAAATRSTITLYLNRSYNPVWYTGNELSQITPLPLAWDRTSLGGGVPLAAFSRQLTAGGVPDATVTRSLPDTTAAGARAVYHFLNGQAERLSGYASSPVWSIVDGAWKLTQLTSSGQATFVPNRRYGGPDKPHLSRFVELPFTSDAAELSVLKAGAATGDGRSSGPQISVGYVADEDAPQASSLSAQGYRLVKSLPFAFDYFEPNFNNPQVGPIFRQLYFRQAFQHLVNQSGWIHAYYNNLGVPTYSPVPSQPANPYSDPLATRNPYPFSIAAARKLLTAHGWHVIPGGVTSCVRPGTGPGDCGAGIARGKQLKFTLMYPDDDSYTGGSMTNLEGDARQVGIAIALKSVTSSTIDADIEPCTAKQAACDWQLGNYGGSWVFEPDHYPSGEEIFQTGALGNVNNFSDHAIDKLIVATTTVPAGKAQAALDAYADAVRTALPDFWQPADEQLLTVQSNLGGVVPNAYGFISPEQWYFTK